MALNGKLTNYWKLKANDVIKSVRSSGLNKANYFGDISPLPESYFPHKALAINDTILVPCGVEKMLKFVENYDERAIFFYLIKHTLQMLELEVFENLGVNHPSVIVVPNVLFHEESHAEEMARSASQATLRTYNKLYDKTFTSIEDILAFSATFRNPKEMAKEARKNVIDWEPDIENGDLEEYYDKNMQMVGVHSKNEDLFGIFNLILGKRTQSADALYITNFWDSSPLTDNEASYMSMLDFLKYSSPSRDDEQFVDQVFYNSKVPFLDFTKENCAKLRDNNQIRKLRASISSELKELNCKDRVSFERAVNRVEIKLIQEFDEYKRSLDDLKNQYIGDLKLNMTGALSFGAISIACFMWPAFVKYAGISSLIGTSNLINLFKDRKKYIEKVGEVKRGYIAILCK